MHRGFPVLRRGAALLVLALLLAPVVIADDLPLPPPPEARIGVPGGLAGQAASDTVWDRFLVWLQARLGVPGG